MASDEFRLVSPEINSEGRLLGSTARSQERLVSSLGVVQRARRDQELGPSGAGHRRPDPSGPIVPWVTWVVVNMPPTHKGLPEGFSGEKEVIGGDYGGILEGYNYYKLPGWRGPKLPSHGRRFEFMLNELDDEVHLGNKVTKDKLLEAIQGHVLGEAVLMAIS